MRASLVHGLVMLLIGGVELIRFAVDRLTIRRHRSRFDCRARRAPGPPGPGFLRPPLGCRQKLAFVSQLSLS